MSMSSRTCLITGASSGIGWAAAHALDRENAKLILAGRNTQALEKLRDELNNKHQVVTADLACVHGQQSIIELIVNRPEINTIIHCAGVSCFGELEHVSSDILITTIQTNLLAPMLITQAVLPALKQRGAVDIVNVGSAFGSIGFPYYSIYSASKFGLRGFSESLHRELKGSKVRVKYLSPRATATQFNSESETALNSALGNTIDPPDYVAQEMIKLLASRRSRRFIGWPEKLFSRINGLLPELVDRAIGKQHAQIQHYATSATPNQSQSANAPDKNPIGARS